MPEQENRGSNAIISFFFFSFFILLRDKQSQIKTFKTQSQGETDQVSSVGNWIAETDDRLKIPALRLWAHDSDKKSR